MTIDGEVERLRPGMSASVDIHVERIKDVLSVPVQAIVEIGDDTWCYVHGRNGIERRVLELGRSNDKFVEVRKGLEAGDQVVLNTMAIIDESRESTQDEPPVSDSEEERESGRSNSRPDVAALN